MRNVFTDITECRREHGLNVFSEKLRYILSDQLMIKNNTPNLHMGYYCCLHKPVVDHMGPAELIKRQRTISTRAENQHLSDTDMNGECTGEKILQDSKLFESTRPKSVSLLIAIQ